MEKVLITGSDGFIGRNLAEQLASDFRVLAPKHAELDLLDSAAVEGFLGANRVDAVLHCATHNATRTSTKDLSRVLHSNLSMFFNIARCGSQFGRMFSFGSGAEFDVRHFVPRMPESYFDTYVPADDYGLSKYVIAKHIETTPNLFNLRVFGCYGRYEDWRIRFISSAICRAIFGMDITMQQNVFFDYLYVDDLVRIVRTLLLGMPDIPLHTYNLCRGESIDLMTLAQHVRDIAGTDVAIRAAAPGLKPEYTGDNGRLLDLIGPFHFTPHEQAVRELCAWYHDHRGALNPDELV